ncbi:MAG: hypothetical protein HYY04_14165 [Chloroflexi bacterium]|nr:hypothetical protein [Chloroflexota bacterium]
MSEPRWYEVPGSAVDASTSLPGAGNQPSGGASKTASPRRIIALIGDLFFESRLVPLARQVGAEVCFVHDVNQLRGALHGAIDEAPALVLVNLATRIPDPFEAIATAKAASPVPVVAFGPHKDVEARRRALAAGSDRWLPNSQLAKEFPRLVRRLLDGSGLAPDDEPLDDE